MKILKSHKLVSIAKFCTFTIIAVGMLAGIFHVLWLHDNTYSKQSFEEFYEQPKNTVDVVLTGSSGMKEYFIPSEAYHDYGVTVGNLSSSAQMFRSVQYLVREAKKTQNPKLFVVETRMLLYDNGQIDDSAMRKVTDSMHYSENWYEAVNGLYKDVNKAQPDEKLKLHDHLFSFDMYHSRWKELNGGDFHKYPYLWGGYLVNTNTQPFDSLPVYAAEVEPEPITKVEEKALKDTLKFCKTQTDTQFLFVTVPYYMEEKHQKRNEYVAEIIKEAGFDYIDLNSVVDQMGIDPQVDIRDWQHVNSYGALKYTDWLTNYLQQTYALPDHRTDGTSNYLNEDFTELREKLMQVSIDVNQYMSVLYRNIDYATIRVFYSDHVWNDLLTEGQRAQLTALEEAGVLERVEDASEGKGDFKENALCFEITDIQTGEIIDLAEYHFNEKTKEMELLHNGTEVDYWSYE